MGTLDKDLSEVGYFRSSILNISNENENAVCDKNLIDNLILNVVMPDFEAGTMEWTGRNQKEHTLEAEGSEKTSLSKVKVNIAGSLGEGLFLPGIVHMKGKRCYIEFPDRDRKVILCGFVVNPALHRTFAIPERSSHKDSPPAFLQLRYNPIFTTHIQSQNKKLKEWNPGELLTKHGLVNRKKFLKCMRPVLMKLLELDKQTDESFPCYRDHIIHTSDNGPAFTVEVEDEDTKVHRYNDYVICLPCPAWPEPANKWPNRQRVWPGKSTVRKVVRNGCHIVLKPFKKEKARDAEFSYSFSLCDRIIIETLNLYQRRCYLLFKFVFKFSLNRVNRGLSSYACKTTFLRLCEKIPGREWTESNPLQCLVLLLKKLKSHLVEHNLPHFYIPEYNLVGDLSKLCLAAYVKEIDKVLESPVQVVLGLTENHRFCWLSTDISIFSHFQILLSMNMTTKKLLANCVVSYMSDLVDKGEITNVIAIACGHFDVDFIDFEMKNITDVFERLITNFQDHKDVVNFQGLLANLYHQTGMKNIEIFGVDKRFINKGLHLFEKSLPLTGHHIWMYGSYYDLLLQMQEYKRIIQHFNWTVRPCLSDSGIYNKIHYYNYLTAYPAFPIDINEVAPCIPSPGYILLKVSLAYVHLSRNVASMSQADALELQGKRILHYFDKWVQKKCRLYPTYDDIFLNWTVSFAAYEVCEDSVCKSALSRSRSINRTSRTTKDKFLDWKSYFGSFTDTISENQDRLNKYRHGLRYSWRYHPYNITNKTKAYRLPNNLRFFAGVVRIGDFNGAIYKF